MPIQTARKKSPYHYRLPMRPPPPKRGIPKLAAYEPPPPPPQSPPRLRKKPGAKKRTAIKKVVKAKATESPKSFNFLGLPAELRNTIYELCVSVSNYITYDDRDFCTCGKPFLDDGTDEDHDKDGSSCTFKVQRLDDLDEMMCFPRLPGRFYVLTSNKPNELSSPLPPILQANRQIRKEALPIFFAMNEFTFEQCNGMSVARWLFNGVQLDHLRHIKSITWNGMMEYWSHVQAHVHPGSLGLCSVIMLMQLGFLGNCKVQFTAKDFNSLHTACIMRDMIKQVIQRKGLTETDAENESGELDQLETRGLVYATSEKFISWSLEAWGEMDEMDEMGEDYPPTHCDCTAPTADRQTPFIMLEQSAYVDEAAGQHSMDIA